MATIGRFALVLALLLALYGAAAAAIGSRRGRPQLVESARTTAFSLLIVIAAANAAMLVAILGNDFGLRYVAENSSRATPTFFKVLSLWSADEGSLLLWNLVLAGYLAAVAFAFRRRTIGPFPWALMTMYAVSAFYLLLVVVADPPFDTLAVTPADGRGPLPLLQNHPLMAVHPPLLYLGFIGFTVPFAFAIGTLVERDAGTPWMAITRRWTLLAWTFLSAGLLLGALWSYHVLGWGGYWAWDPVENVALLPWLLATAYLHAAMLHERGGVLRTWNLSLVVGTFALTTFGTFLTRGSVLLSVHAFADSLVGPLYLGFLVLVMLVGFGLVAARTARRPPGRLGSLVSRGSALLVNNLVLVVITFTILLGTMFPLAMEAITGRRVSVGAPYFEQSTVPPLLLLLFLMGVGPLLPWRHVTADRLTGRFTVPAAAGALTVLALAVVRVRSAAGLAALGLAAFVLTSNGGELVRRVRATRRHLGTGWARAALASWSHDPRSTGGLVVHLGIALAAVAITTSSTFGTQTEVTLSRGQRVAFAGYDLEYLGRRVLQQPQREVLVADIDLWKAGRPAGTLTPSLNLYPGAGEPIGSPSIRTGAVADLYASVVSFDADGESATFRLFRNPGVTWLWVGGGVVVLGGLLAVRPRRRERRPPPPTVSTEEPLRRELVAT